MIKHTQCLWYALDRWHERGGYLMYRKSTHWCMPHVMHVDVVGGLYHFVPPADLNAAWLSVIGFDGQVLSSDKEHAVPIGKLCIFFGTLMMLVLGGVWAIKRVVRPIP